MPDSRKRKTPLMQAAVCQQSPHFFRYPAAGSLFLCRILHLERVDAPVGDLCPHDAVDLLASVQNGIAMLPVEDHFHAIFVPVLIHAVAIDAAHILHGNDSALPPGFFLPSTGSIIRQIPTDSF